MNDKMWNLTGDLLLAGFSITLLVACLTNPVATLVLTSVLLGYFGFEAVYLVAGELEAGCQRYKSRSIFKRIK